MNGTLRRLAVALFSTAVAHATLIAQNVLLHEVRADANGRWIELHNRSNASVDLSQWSLHHCTTTPLTVRNYWWAFPVGTTIDAGGYLRVHWLQAAPSSPAQGELYTGDTPWHFLFSQGAEALNGDAGALGLLRSQNVAMMSSPSIVEDWVSWGQAGFSREHLAVQANVWQTGQFTPPIAAGTSLARNTPTVGTLASRSLEWFSDATPTPLAANVSGVIVENYSHACVTIGNHLLGLPTLRASSLPIIGNAQFAYTVDNTTGVFGELMVIALAHAAASASQLSLLPTLPGSNCREALAHGSVLTVLMRPTQLLQTQVPLSLGNLGPAFCGLELHAQAMVFETLPNAWPPYQGISNAVRIVIGQ